MYTKITVNYNYWDFGILIINGDAYCFDVFKYIEFSLN